MQCIDADTEIHTRSRPQCYLCGSSGRPVYRGLRDLIFGVPGEWCFNECSNADCGLIWLDPMPLDEETVKAYARYYTHQGSMDGIQHNQVLWRIYNLVKRNYLAYKFGYSSRSITIWNKLIGVLIYFHPGQRANVDCNVMYLPRQENGCLLDVGCGSGGLIKFMQDLGWRVEGLDFDRDAVRNARAKGLRVNLGKLKDQQYPDGSFDVITMSHLIEHIHDPLSLLQECRRILKPGGRLVAVTPNSASWGHRLFKENWRGLEPPRHLNVFSTKSLHYLVKRAGFKEIRIWTTIRNVHWMFMASRSLKRGRYVLESREMRSVRIWARLMQLIAWGALKLKPDIGEEIALIAEK